MTYKEYFLEAVSEAFYAIGKPELFDSLTKEERESISGDIETSVDCMGQAFYTPPASDRINSERRESESKVKQLEKELDEWRSAFMKNVAARHRCDVQDVNINKDGSATIRP